MLLCLVCGDELNSLAMVIAGGPQPVSHFPATISKKLNNGSL